MLTVEDQLELIRVAKERLDSVIEMLEGAILKIDNDNTPPEKRLLEVRSEINEALVALQGPKKT